MPPGVRHSLATEQQQLHISGIASSPDGREGRQDVKEAVALQSLPAGNGPVEIPVPNVYRSSENSDSPRGFRGDSVVRKNPPADAEDRGPILLQEDPTCHKATKLMPTATESVLWSPGTPPTEPTHRNH